jgi:hypothetical protein
MKELDIDMVDRYKVEMMYTVYSLWNSLNRELPINPPVNDWPREIPAFDFQLLKRLGPCRNAQHKREAFVNADHLLECSDATT